MLWVQPAEEGVVADGAQLHHRIVDALGGRLLVSAVSRNNVSHSTWWKAANTSFRLLTILLYTCWLLLPERDAFDG